MAEAAEVLAELLQSVNRDIYENIREVLHAGNLPAISLMVLREVRQAPGITVGEVARHSRMAKSHISKTVESLSRQGLIEKRSDPTDQRLVRVYLTAQAETRFQEVRQKVLQQLSKVMAKVPPEKVAVLIEGLQTLKAALAERKE